MLYAKIESTINQLNTNQISKDQKITLEPLIDYIQKKAESKQIINLNFICTHNSRRSHLTQVWAQVMASYFDVKNVYCFSGGTEATALFPAVKKVLELVGFKIEPISVSNNPIYSITYSDEAHPIIGFSKTYDTNFNPKTNFVAIMTCTKASENCPFIIGATKRIVLTYEDPKVYDNTSKQSQKYMESSIQIANELKYVFSKIKK